MTLMGIFITGLVGISFLTILFYFFLDMSANNHSDE
jgi:hypothetical protein